MTGEFLCRRFATERVASTRQTPTARSIRAPVAPFRVSVLADPRGDLQAAYREGMEIKSFLDARRVSYREGLNAARKELILKALATTKGKRSAAAKILGIEAKYLFKLMKSLQID